jgi:hypothetical protein
MLYRARCLATGLRSARQPHFYWAAALGLMGMLLATSPAMALPCAAPTVTTNPISQTVCAGQTVTFAAAASGSPPLTIQWEVSTDGGASFHSIDNANSNTYSFIASSSQNGYQYHAMFFNDSGFNRTVPATLTVGSAPQLNIVSVSPSVIWPPNNKMVLVTVQFAATSLCGLSSSGIAGVTNNETGLADAQIVDASHVLIRASRFGSGRGRIYTITVGATDSSGHTTTKTALVTVPHDQGQ